MIQHNVLVQYIFPQVVVFDLIKVVGVKVDLLDDVGLFVRVGVALLLRFSDLELSGGFPIQAQRVSIRVAVALNE